MKEFLTIGEKSLVSSLGVWGLLLLAILALVLAIVASVSGSGNDYSPSF